MEKRNKIIYWIATGLFTLGMISGGLAQLFRVKQNVDGLIALGYPEYIMTLLGILKILGVITVLVPKLPLLKEWAYAGFCFLMTGIFYSHAMSGNYTPGVLIGHVLLFVLIITSWHFRPDDRKM